MIEDLKIIKKKYGEKMMHFCRDNFATILEEPGVLSDLLLTFFEPSKELFNDLKKANLEANFKSFIYRKFNKEEILTITENKTPQELLASVGYDLYECKSEEDIQSFKKYYAPCEKLCTFNGGRLNDCYVFFAVKKDVDNIKREDFNHPKRQDLYGTSVISIQFDKNEAHTLSIKNRYNHTVKNPDATFSNNLDNIVEGLTSSFAHYYNLNQKYISEFEIPDYICDGQGKNYKYNYEINGINYCPNNCILVNHEIIKFPKERYILADYFLIDRQEKTIRCYDQEESDCFPQFFQDNPIKKIDLVIIADTKVVKIETIKGLVTLELDQRNRIIGLTNPYIEEINDDFLYYNESLTKIELPQVKIIGNNFLTFSKSLKAIELPKVIEIGTHFLDSNEILKKIALPCVKTIGYNFLSDNEALEEIYLPNVLEIEDSFLYYNQILKQIFLPQVKIIGSDFMYSNTSLTKVNFPKLEIVGDTFLSQNTILKELNLPQVTKVGYNFLCNNQDLYQINLSNVVKIDKNFLYYNNALKTLYLPKVLEIEDNFLCNNKCLQEIYLPNILKIANYFLYENVSLVNLNLPNIKYIGSWCLANNIWLQNFNINENSRCLSKN